MSLSFADKAFLIKILSEHGKKLAQQLQTERVSDQLAVMIKHEINCAANISQKIIESEDSSQCKCETCNGCIGK